MRVAQHTGAWASAVPQPSETAAFAAAELRRLAKSCRSDELVVLTVPAPVVPLETMCDAFPQDSCVLWQAPSGHGAAAAGVTRQITGHGATRYDQVREQALGIWPRLVQATYPGLLAPPPRLYGGFAFSTESASEAPWVGFGDARFVLPRWCYGYDPTLRTAWLRLTTTQWNAHGAVHRLTGELQQVLFDLQTHKGRTSTTSTLVESLDVDVDHFSSLVEGIRREIIEGRCEKVVAARRTVIDMSHPIDVSTVLERLGDRYRDCFRFGFRAAGSWFVGATPERLISRRGNVACTEALAGSIELPTPDARAQEDLAAQLLASAKDRGEQALVVQAIQQVLAPLCTRLDVAQEPEIRSLRHVLHLQTPITGELSSETHVLDLVAALHPTPAVGGTPTAAAMRWIAAHESQPRGWYAAPIGWFDASGDGEFAVAIRSALITGRRAHLYAGSGIVRDSDPAAELRETKVKQRALLGALGASK